MTIGASVSWTGTDLKNKVLNSGRHDVVFLAGHFSANDALAADYSTDMITSTPPIAAWLGVAPACAKPPGVSVSTTLVAS